MKYIITTLFIITVGILSVKLQAQNYHLSQYDASVMTINPAMTGIYFGNPQDYNIYGSFRQQWRATGKPFTTAGIGYDMQLNERFGIGGYAINHRAGASQFNNLNFLLSGAYQILNDPEGRHNLSVGIQMGVFQKSYNPENLYFDNQYSPESGGFDNNLPSGENFENTGLIRFNSNMGVFYKMNDSKRQFNPFGGFSIYNINKPNESFTSEKSRMPMRFTFHVGTEIEVNDLISLTPSILYMYQGKAQEINIGLMGSYLIKNNTNYDLLYGLAYRYKDAVILHAGVKHGLNYYRLSYDVTSNSDLKNNANAKGSVEFSVVFAGIFGGASKSNHIRLAPDFN